MNYISGTNHAGHLKTPMDWLSRNPEALLKQLYDTNFPWLEKYVRQHAGTAQDAQDIFQESLVAAWVNGKEGRFAGTAEEFNAYLRQICKYKWINLVKSAAHRNIRYTEDVSVFDRAADSTHTQEEQLLQASLLSTSFQQLGQKCKEVLGLFYYQRKSLAEIAAEQSNTEDSIKTIKYRCMMQLRKIYLEKSRGHGER